jgi:hypothetical protein
MSLFNVGFVIFPELTQLDFTGPQQVLARLPESAMHIVAKTTNPVPSDSGLSLVPTHTFENCPRLDLICIPGGITGVIQAMGDRETIEFVQRQSSTAKYVSSGVYRGLHSRCCWIAQGAPRDHTLGLCPAAPAGWRYTPKGPRRERWKPDHGGRRHIRYRLWAPDGGRYRG